jgi:D-glycero-D-manno-heptose 1,7-bisphosphate phosphatase
MIYANRAIFLDRDGVLNRPLIKEGKPYPPRSLAEAEILPGVAEALADLKRAGFLTIVVTNQPDVARGTTRRETVQEIDAFLASRLPLDEVMVCYHDDRDGCECRKPAPGLLVAAAKRHGIDLARSYLVGDRWRDIEAGQRAGCVTILLDYGYAERGPSAPPHATCRSLLDASRWILHQNSQREIT